MKNVVISETAANTETLHEFQAIIEKITNTRTLKTCLYQTCRLLEFLESNSIFNNLHFKWAKEKEEETARLHSLGLQVYNRSKIAYDTLKCRLVKQKLIDLPEIESIVIKMDTLFANHEPSCSPPPWQLAFDGVKTLGIALEKMGRTDLLKDLADLRTISEGSVISKERIIIDLFTFAEGITDLTQLQNDFYFRMTPWSI